MAKTLDGLIEGLQKDMINSNKAFQALLAIDSSNSIEQARLLNEYISSLEDSIIMLRSIKERLKNEYDIHAIAEHAQRIAALENTVRNLRFSSHFVPLQMTSYFSLVSEPGYLCKSNIS